MARQRHALTLVGGLEALAFDCAGQTVGTVPVADPDLRVTAISVNGVDVESIGIESAWAFITIVLPPRVTGSRIEIQRHLARREVGRKLIQIAWISSHAAMKPLDGSVERGDHPLGLLDTFGEERFLVGEVLMQLAVEIIPWKSPQ